MTPKVLQRAVDVERIKRDRLRAENDLQCWDVDPEQCLNNRVADPAYLRLRIATCGLKLSVIADIERLLRRLNSLLS